MYTHQSSHSQQLQSPHHQQHPQGSWDGNQHVDLQFRHQPNGQQGSLGSSSYGPPHQQQQQQQQHQPPPSNHQPANLRADRPEMATVQPHYGHAQPPDMFRLPAPSQFYSPQAPLSHPDYQPAQAPAGTVAQSAPRQRTAIACKYCRRRKIRCSGFESSADGRCTNCVRFSQDCVFTPVSQQTQAFVPAQAVYGPNARGRGGDQGPVQFYGSYGQPLPRQPDAYGPPPPPPQQGYGMPPAAQYGAPPYGQQYSPQQQFDQQPLPGNRRRHDEPHTPTLPPPNPGSNSHLAQRDGELGPATQPQSSAPYHYADPSSYSNGAESPASSTTSYQQVPQPYYGAPPGRRTSPNSVYSYDPKLDSSARTSTSPNASIHPYSYGQTGGQPPAMPPYLDSRAPTLQPKHSSSSTENVTSKGVGFKIRDLVSDSKSKVKNGANGQPERSTADNAMVSALNRTSRR